MKKKKRFWETVVWSCFIRVLTTIHAGLLCSIHGWSFGCAWLMLELSKSMYMVYLFILSLSNMLFIQEVLVASDNQEQLEHAHNSSDNPEVALKLESSGSAKDNGEEQPPCLTNIRDNQIEQSTDVHEDSAAYALPPSKKKIKLGNSNGTAMRTRPIKKLTEENVSDAPLLASASHLRKMDETTKEPDGDLATPKMERTGARCSKKSVIVERPSAVVEGAFLGKRIVS